MESPQGLRTWHRPLLWGVALMIGTLVLSIGGLMFDDRVLLGEPIWLKPFKFSVSIGIYSFTLAWLVSLLQRGRRLAWWMGTVTTVTAAVEMVVIILQVLRGQPSHFNSSSDLNATLFQVMAISIVTLWLSNAVIAVLVLRERAVERPLLWALRFGLLLALAGMAVAFMMPPPKPDQLAMMKEGIDPPMVGGHAVGVPDGGPGMPITHWSTTGGDLRVPHFLGIHALQALPLLAMFLRRYSGRAALVQIRLIFVGAAAYAGLIGLVTWQALRGQPLIYPDGLTLGVLALIVVAVLTATAAVLRDKTEAFV
jgi:hypothetical protein